MIDDPGWELDRDTRERLARIYTSDSTPPPWVDSEFNEDAAAALWAQFGEAVRDMYHELGEPTGSRLEVLQFLFFRAATWGWDCAMNNGPTAQRNAMAAAAAARKAKAEDARSRVVEAFQRAAAAGCEPDIDAIANECGVSRATAYRALGNRE